MLPKKGKKRKAAAKANGTDDPTSEAPLEVPDRATWPGWVEMESEPAFFNVMLKEMGVRGVKIQEVYGLDEEMLAILPHPVHALIFLFRYREVDEAKQQKGTKCPEHVWFANQVPDFACASVAMLNIVNNIKGLEMGKELRDFKHFTQNMDPLSRGHAIDGFTFVKRIHNSFARENDLLNADMHIKRKANQAKKRQAIAKARATKEAKKAEKAEATPLKEQSPNIRSTPVRSSGRKPKTADEPVEPTSRKTTTLDSRGSSPLSDQPDSDTDFARPSKQKTAAAEQTNGIRRSERKPKPRQSFAESAKAVAEADDEEGFHFIAYMPLEGQVWKLDGLDGFPHDMGVFDAASGGDWMNIAQTELQTRMMMYEGADIEFNLMAVVRDPMVRDREELLRNVRLLQVVEKKLNGVFGDWRSLDGAESTRGLIIGPSVDFDVCQADIDAMELSNCKAEEIENEDNLLKLVEMRKTIVCEQASLRAAIRDAMESAKGDDEKSRHRRHDYGKFVRSWLGALAENEILSGLLEDG